MKTLHKNILGFTSLAFIIASEALAADDTHGLVYDIEHVDPHGPVGDATHEASAGLPQLDPTWFASQIFWLLIVFGALYFIFSRSILPALSTTLENRHEHIQSDLDTAERLKEEAETVQSNYEAVLVDARAKASTPPIKAIWISRRPMQASLRLRCQRSSRRPRWRHPELGRICSTRQLE